MEGRYPRPQRDRPEVWTVDQVTRELKSVIETRFPSLSVEGEVVSCRPSSAGHVYFSLKGQRATLPAVVFRSTAQRFGRPIRNGDRLVCSGGIEVYPPHGRYQLVINWIRVGGEGELLAALEQLKQRLHAEGLFAPERKRPLPPMPRRIGLITSHTGAAVRDMIRSIHSRFPVPLLVAAAPVQGDGAAFALIDALHALAAIEDVDVIVIGRGGGSLEDLWQFNNEALARAIATCPTPVVSAVGHEIDMPISDLVADARAPTPMAVGELVVPSVSSLAEALERRRARALRAMVHLLRHTRGRLDAASRRVADPRRLLRDGWLRLDDLQARAARALSSTLRFRRQQLDTTRRRLVDPRQRLNTQRHRLSELRSRLEIAVRRALIARRTQLELADRALMRRPPTARVQLLRSALASYRGRLQRELAQQLRRSRQGLESQRKQLISLNPAAVLERGFAIVHTADGAIVRSSRDVDTGAPLAVRLASGHLDVVVQATHEGLPPEGT